MYRIVCLLLLLSGKASAQKEKGDNANEIYFTTILNAPQQQAALSQLKGKVVLLEFWATWCGSCLSAMPHLMDLQKKFPDKLQVITITNESENRITSYLKARPSNLWFAIDTGETISRVFPHQMLPHTILISPTGEQQPGTNPEAVTASVIENLLTGKKVQLPIKEDVTFTSPEDLMQSVFPLDPVTKKRFMMQPGLKGVPGFSTTYPSDSQYAGRRITAVNVTLPDLYRLAHGGFPYKRTKDLTTEADRAAVYCLDILVENPDDLLPTMVAELLKRFDVRARIDIERKEVTILKISDAEKFNTIPQNLNGKRTYFARHGEINQQAITMEGFASYLESFGTGKMLVIDETKNVSKFDIKFSFQPEDPASLTKILDAMGLVLEKQSRDIKVLVISRSK